MNDNVTKEIIEQFRAMSDIHQVAASSLLLDDLTEQQLEEIGLHIGTNLTYWNDEVHNPAWLHKKVADSIRSILMEPIMRGVNRGLGISLDHREW